MTYLDCWISAATALFAQALAGEPELVDSLPRPMGASIAFTATISGDQEGRFTVILDSAVLEPPLLGEGVEQQGAWAELLREVADAAVGELLAKTGKKCRVDRFEASKGEDKVSRAFQLKSGEHAWTVLVRDEVRAPKTEKKKVVAAATPAGTQSGAAPAPSAPARGEDGVAMLTPGLELLLDVELEATLRFGCRELPLGQILDLGPGDVVQLDRHVDDPADLIVGDKIVARGEVVLVNGNFGLRVTEVAAPRKRLETIRCLF
ncbi:MAG TPA: FliM/FliN family flagellar motor C-terminal domain-containing protein [Terracidiphilus sp.]|jgi:flagellar motor switch protein FliN